MLTARHPEIFSAEMILAHQSVQALALDIRPLGRARDVASSGFEELNEIVLRRPIARQIEHLTITQLD